MFTVDPNTDFEITMLLDCSYRGEKEETISIPKGIFGYCPKVDTNGVTMKESIQAGREKH